MDQESLQPSLIKLSASAAKTFEQCRKKYQFNYILKYPKKEWPHLLLGTFCHKVLELFHLKWRQDKNQSLVDLMGECFLEARKHLPTLKPEQLEEAKELLQDYLFSMEKNGMPNTLAEELSFELKIDKYLLRGSIDRVDVDRDAVFHIFDYKTTKNSKYLDDFQLLVYGLALKNKYPEIEKLRGSYILLRQGSKLINYDFDLKDIIKCEQKIIEFGKQIENEDRWDPRPSPLCKWCDFYEPCQGGGTDKVAKDIWI